ncbi:MAG: membrane protein insertion efficiency factor YidD [Lentisphaerae bacterium]|nr:membrane protein insertion efficiency factor YidD [Lentisphaerota bacterium]
MRALLILLVRAYQVVLSPLFTGCCRFEPSCSNYMIEALQTHGAVKGLYLGMMRLLRCHPFGKSGYDPVPPGKS